MRKPLSPRSMARVSLLAALLAVLSQISVPLPSGVPLTLQTLGIALAGCLLGPFRGAAAVGLYILLGAVGLPVFSGFSGGFGVLVGVTGGFIWGFLPFALLCGLSAGRGSLPARAALCLAGLLLCHLLGVLQFSLVTGTGFLQSALTVSLPYLAKDAASTAVAALAARSAGKALKRAGLQA